jgi:hypothetical protein
LLIVFTLLIASALLIYESGKQQTTESKAATPTDTLTPTPTNTATPTPAFLFDDEFNGFTLFDRDALWVETHAIEHVHCDSSFGIDSFTRFPDGI